MGVDCHCNPRSHILYPRYFQGSAQLRIFVRRISFFTTTYTVPVQFSSHGRGLPLSIINSCTLQYMCTSTTKFFRAPPKCRESKGFRQTRLVHLLHSKAGFYCINGTENLKTCLCELAFQFERRNRTDFQIRTNYLQHFYCIS